MHSVTCPSGPEIFVLSHQPDDCRAAFDKRWPKKAFQDDEFYSLAFLVWNSCRAVARVMERESVTQFPAHETIVKVAREYAERFGMPHKELKGFRLSHEDDMTKGITAAIYEIIRPMMPTPPTDIEGGKP